MFRFALVDAENAEYLGIVAFMRPDVAPGDVIPQGKGRMLRVVRVVDSERDEDLPLLVVEPHRLSDPR